MANITFSSPRMKKDVTVYAVAGDRGTLLAVAKTHKIPIPFDCGDGECGSCLVQVTHTSPHPRKGLYMTEKEKEALRQIGKITPEEIEAAETSDFPPKHRLACQFFVRDEDILVTFEGDTTMPAQRPAVTHAAPIVKGTMEINDVGTFLACALRVEAEAAAHFDELSAAMTACGNVEVGTLFKQLADYSRLHHAEAKQRAGERDVSALTPLDHLWPHFETPEQTTLFAGDAALSRRDALKAALEGERRGFEFYHKVALTTKDSEVRTLAREFVREESEHVELLQRAIARAEAELVAA